MKFGRRYFVEFQLNGNDYRTIGMMAMPEQTISDMHKRYYLSFYFYLKQVVVIFGWPRKLQRTAM